jgi:hypothetical protein
MTKWGRGGKAAAGRRSTKGRAPKSPAEVFRLRFWGKAQTLRLPEGRQTAELRRLQFREGGILAFIGCFQHLFICIPAMGRTTEQGAYQLCIKRMAVRRIGPPATLNISLISA